MARGFRRGCAKLKGAVIGIDDEEETTFTITNDQKTFHLQARDRDEREKWVQALEETIKTSSQSSMDKSKGRATAGDFDKCMYEADCYLQILIEQVKSFGEKADSSEDYDTDTEKYEDIKAAGEAMIESVKKTIVHMQMARTKMRFAEDPVMSAGKPRGSSIEDVDSNSLKSRSESFTETSSVDLSDAAASGSKSGWEDANKGDFDETVPVTSYSSSEDEDFFDAEERSSPTSPVRPRPNQGLLDEDFAPPNGQVLSPLSPMTAQSEAKDGQVADLLGLDTPTSGSPAPSGNSPPSADPSDTLPALLLKKNMVDSGALRAANMNSSRTSTTSSSQQIPAFYDELYDDNKDEELDSLDSHGSMIRHLISQVRIGMDLTKIVLPTFILERRSLLEMFADFFAHPDYFVTIADQKTPEQRMIQVVRWYLSAFHAGRNSEVAKKPYNPIIGETFSCAWDVPGLPCSQAAFTDRGPVKWATKNNLVFIAEQVSHHPPGMYRVKVKPLYSPAQKEVTPMELSAFYAEHQSNNISLDGYIWTKSRFLGLSIAVHMIGQSVISLPEYGEEYKITFPSAYARSILTVPWVELGGKCEVTCEKTGYHSTIEFLTKPFYGGKKGLIKASVYAPMRQQPIRTIQGEWNGIMYSQNAAGHNELFVDTRHTPIIRKCVLPIEKQTEFESRRLWKNVTRCLKDKDITQATRFKQKLEQRQRDEAKDRAERHQKWKTKHFHEVGEHWVYKDSLPNRKS